MASTSKSVPSRGFWSAQPMARLPVCGVGSSLGGHPLLRSAVSRREFVSSSRGSCATKVATQEPKVNGTSYHKDDEEDAVLKIVESLKGDDKAKALALWEENKRMRVKLAILEGISELPAGERMRALSLLKKNRSLRSKTNSLMASWADMEGTVNGLIKAEVEASTCGTVSDSDVYLSSAEMDVLSGASDAPGAAPISEEEGSAFWDVGLSATGLVTLLASTGPLELALAKASIILRDNIDEILNNYWERELGISPETSVAAKDEVKLSSVAFADESAAAVHDYPQPSTASYSPTALTRLSAKEEEHEPPVEHHLKEESHGAKWPAKSWVATNLKEVSTVKAIGEATAEEKEKRLEGFLTEGMVELDAEKVDSRHGEVADTEKVEVMASDVVMASEMPKKETSAPEKSLSSAVEMKAVQATKVGGGRGGMAAVAGLGAGLLAVAAGLEATVAMEIMATTALITSAGNIMTDEAETGSVREKGAGAPALVAIAATLNAAEQMARSIDRALESEVVKATSQALGSANKIRELAEPKLEAQATPIAKPDNAKQEEDDVPLPTVGSCPVANVVFRVEKQLPFGHAMKVVGGCSALGDWDASGALSMEWEVTTGAWVAAAQLPDGPVEFKLLVGSGDQWSWEAPMAGNRLVQVASGATTRVRCVFDDVEAVHLLDEEDNSEPIETPQVTLIEDEAPILTPEAEMQHVQTEVLEMQMPGADEKLIVFRVQKEVPFGNSVKVVGGLESLGSWDSRRALPMVWGSGHVWSARVPMPPGLCEFKFVVASDSGDYVHWEAIPGNRRLQVPNDASLIVAEADFDDDEDIRLSMDEEALLLADEPVVAC